MIYLIRKVLARRLRALASLVEPDPVRVIDSIEIVGIKSAPGGGLSVSSRITAAHDEPK